MTRPTRVPRLLFGVLVLVVSAVAAAACGSGDDRQPLLVMAAASLTDVFSDIESAFEARHPDIDVQLNLAGSASLREQILQGAPADVFASANTRTMSELVAAEAVASPVVFASNRLALAVPIGNPAGVTGLDALGDDALFVGLCAEGVPCGDAARDALTQAGIVAAPDTNEGDVRALLTKLEAGELDVGVVYRTDVAASDQVEAVELEAPFGSQLDYPIAVVAESNEPDAARIFVDFVSGNEAQGLLESAGFTVP